MNQPLNRNKFITTGNLMDCIKHNGKTDWVDKTKWLTKMTMTTGKCLTMSNKLESHTCWSLTFFKIYLPGLIYCFLFVLSHKILGQSWTLKCRLCGVIKSIWLCLGIKGQVKKIITSCSETYSELKKITYFLPHLLVTDPKKIRHINHMTC